MVLFFILSATASFGEGFWAVEWEDGSKSQERHHQKIPTDQEFQFIIDNIPCHVTKATLSRLKDDLIIEERYLRCLVAKDISVSVRLDYNVRSKDCVDNRQLFIQKNGKSFMPALTVYCK